MNKDWKWNYKMIVIVIVIVICGVNMIGIKKGRINNGKYWDNIGFKMN